MTPIRRTLIGAVSALALSSLAPAQSGSGNQSVIDRYREKLVEEKAALEKEKTGQAGVPEPSPDSTEPKRSGASSFSSPQLSLELPLGPKPAAAPAPVQEGKAGLPASKEAGEGSQGDERGKLYAAFKELDIVQNRFPEDERLLVNLGYLLSSSDRVAEASAVAVQLRSRGGEVSEEDALYLDFQVQMSLRNFEDGLGLIRQLKETEPKSYRVLFSEAQALFLLYRYKEAVTVLEELTETQPRFDSSTTNLLEFQRYACLVKEGRGQEAETLQLVERYDYLSKDPIYYARKALDAFEEGEVAEGMAWMRSMEQIYPPRTSHLYLDLIYEMGYVPNWSYPDRAKFGASVRTENEAGEAGVGELVPR